MRNDTTGVHAAALRVLLICDPHEKCRLTYETADVLLRTMTEYHVDSSISADSVLVPGRPERPLLVAPQQLPSRPAGTQAGRTTLMHAIAHIEFNAINLAWDAVYRFRGMPVDYYRDWIKVAAEEALHFELVCEYLQRQGCAYGDYPAHNGLWEMAVRTQDDVMVRMALVPRVLEARGLDVTPSMIRKFESVGDAAGVSVLNVIYRDEVGHVKAGSRWFRFCCAQRGLESRSTFLNLIADYMRSELRGPYNREARLRAGFDLEELRMLETRTSGGT